MSALRRALALTAGLVLGTAAWAEEAPLTQAQQAALACMTPDAAGRAALKFPRQPLAYEDGGTVSVELTFTAPDRPPEVEVLPQSPGQAVWNVLVSTVERHVRKFRVPCLAPGAASVTVRQDFVFSMEGDRGSLSDEDWMGETADHDTKRWKKCLKHIDPKAALEYSDQDRRQERQDNIWLKLHFNAPDRPPEIEELASLGTPLVRKTVTYVQGFRLPCLPEGERATLVHNYRYKMLGGDRLFLNDLGLVAFLSQVKDLPPAQFKLDEMGCPFDVRLYYRMPTQPNLVRELGIVDERRKPLMNWLAGLTLKLSKTNNTKVLGENLKISIPCGSVDL